MKWKFIWKVENNFAEKHLLQMKIVPFFFDFQLCNQGWHFFRWMHLNLFAPILLIYIQFLVLEQTKITGNSWIGYICSNFFYIGVRRSKNNLSVILWTVSIQNGFKKYEFIIDYALNWFNFGKNKLSCDQLASACDWYVCAILSFFCFLWFIAHYARFNLAGLHW